MADPGKYKSKQEIEEDSPSRRDGISLEYENHVRWCVATLLDAVATQLRLHPSVFPTAMIYFQRFYLNRSLADENYNAAYIALACLFLAGKSTDEQEIKPAKGVIVERALTVLFHRRPEKLPRYFLKEKDLQRVEARMLDAEYELLSGLKFETEFPLPQDILRESIEKLRLPYTDNRAMSKLGTKFLVDGLRTSVNVQYEPHVLGATAIFLALKGYKLIKDPIDECIAQVNEYNELLARTHHGSPFRPMVDGEPSPGPFPQLEKGEPSGTKESEDTAGDPDAEEYPSIEEEGLLRYILEDDEWITPTAQMNQPQNLNIQEAGGVGIAVDEVLAPEDPPVNQEGDETHAPEDQPGNQEGVEALAPEDQPADQDMDEAQAPEDQPADQDIDEAQAPEEQPAVQDGDEPQVPEDQPVDQDEDEPHTPEIQFNYQGGNTTGSPSGGAEYYLHEEDTTESPTNAESAHQSVSPSDAQSDD